LSAGLVAEGGKRSSAGSAEARQAPRVRSGQARENRFLSFPFSALIDQL